MHTLDPAEAETADRDRRIDDANNSVAAVVDAIQWMKLDSPDAIDQTLERLVALQLATGNSIEKAEAFSDFEALVKAQIETLVDLQIRREKDAWRHAA